MSASGVSVTPPLAPVRPATRLRLLDDGQLADLRAATLEILDGVGVHCPSRLVRERYAAHGARVDEASAIVRLSPDLVERAMAAAPRGYTMGARTPAHDAVLDGTALYVATDGCGIETIDPATRERRSSLARDVAAMARVADALPAVGFYWPIVSAGDHPATAPLHELLASVTNTVKHVQTETVMGEPMARYAVEMARVLAGDEATLWARPPLSALICAIAPLAQDAEGMEGALVLAAAGLPVGFMSMATAGSTGPASIAGTIVQGDAEIVAALTLIELEHPGAPVFHSLMTGVMDPRTGGFLATSLGGDPMYAVGVELAHAWGVPTLAGVFGTDARASDWQAAAEAGPALTLCALLGAETGSGMGLLEACTLLVPEQLVLDADLHERVRGDLARLDTSRPALALDVIRSVGPRGHFLYEPSTRDGLRAMPFSALTGRTTIDGMPMAPAMAAREVVERILADHRPEPLDDARRLELERIVAAADRELGGASDATRTAHGTARGVTDGSMGAPARGTGAR
jgi:trimethylamine--corrinoid protein Co-methyltransferase